VKLRVYQEELNLTRFQNTKRTTINLQNTANLLQFQHNKSMNVMVTILVQMAKEFKPLLISYIHWHKSMKTNKI
jgi:hypothetical protein